MSDVGALIKQRRQELDLTLEEVGDAVGVGKSTVRKWETGQIKNMRRDKIALLAKALSISPAMLVPSADGNDEESLSRTENRLIVAYRAADPRYKQLALELLEEHPIKKELSESSAI